MRPDKERSCVQDYMQTVYDTADGIINGVDGVNGLLDQVQTILNVDVNITDISNGITVRLHTNLAAYSF